MSDFPTGERDAILTEFLEEDTAENTTEELEEDSPALVPEVILARKPSEGAENPLLAGEKIAQGRLPGLELVHGQFAQAFQQTLSRALHHQVEMEVRASRVTRFGAYTRMLPDPSSIFLYSMPPLQGLSALVPGQRLIFTLVEHLLGGGGGLKSGGLKKKMENRELTEIEHRMIDPLIGDALMDLAGAWQRVYKAQTRFSHLEINPQRLTLALPNDLVSVSVYEVTLGGESHGLSLCEPLAVLAPIRKRLQGMMRG
jgi:flagellar motor switch protein FliM